MTIDEFLKALPEDEREPMAAFLYGRVPYRFIPRDKAFEKTELLTPLLVRPSPAPSI